MQRHLIVANQTAGGAALEEVVRDRIDRGDATFHVVVPVVAPELEATAWAGAEAGVVLIPEGNPVQDALERSHARLTLLLDKIEAAGGTATGEVVDAAPAQAVRQALEGRTFDEVIISTLPPGLSRWLRMDLPSRVERMTDVPVTVVEAEQ